MSTARCDEFVDVVVIGAGVAGAAAAAAVGLRSPGARVVLLERSGWPRGKVCGCCTNPAGVALLDSLGVGDAVRGAAAAVDSVVVNAGGARMELEHRGGLAVDRRELDAVLVERAVSWGVEFRPGCAARVAECDGGVWCVRVEGRAGSQMVRARAVVVADGLGGSSLNDLPEFRTTIARSAWMGVGGVIDDGAWRGVVEPGTIHMHIGERGYAGIVRLKRDRVAVAAAIDPAWVKECGGPARAVERLIGARVGEIEIPEGALKGTPLLTRRRSRLGEGSLMVIGDAAGYVEPFTGEGMTWALAGAQRAAEVVGCVLAGSLAPEDVAREWAQWHREHIARRQRVCGGVRALLRMPMLAKFAVACGGAMPVVKGAMGLVAARTRGSYGTGAAA